MRSRVVRLTLLGLFVVAGGVSAYLFWIGESRVRAESSAARAFDNRALAAQRGVLDLRAAQQAYVAAGQGDEFWASRVTTIVDSLRDALAVLRSSSSIAQAQSAIDNASSSLQDFEQMDRRARSYVKAGQKLIASDLIFADGLEVTGAAVGSIDQARLAELQSRDDAMWRLRQRQIFAVGAAAAAALLAILLLLPRVEHRAESVVTGLDAAPVPSPKGALGLNDPIAEGWSSARRIAAPPAVVEAPAPAAAIDFACIAALCTDLARVGDTRSLPAILERAATVLDAPGIVVWISDPDGRELTPIVTHGYSPQIVVRLGTIPRDAENATAAAFRTSLVQTVRADAASNGAIAAPLVTPAGAVGVMAAEVRHAGEGNAAKLAAATIVAAQLATLVGPPSLRAHTRTETAGAGV